MSLILRLSAPSALLLMAAGCVSIGPQEIDLTALRQVLQRLNERPEVIAALPDTLLDNSGIEDLNCSRGNMSRSFEKTYSKQIDDVPLWLINADIVVHCSEEAAFQYMEAICKIGWSRTSRETVDILTDAHGSTCVSSILQQRNQGLIPASSFISHAAVQSGIIVVTFSEIHRWKLKAVKQVAIDDVAGRLFKVLENHPAHSATQ